MEHKNRNKMKILVVDDDEKFSLRLSKFLKKKDTHCVVAKNGPEALERMISDKPEMIFMDISMPGLDGLETLQQMKARNTIVPVIMITGHGTMQTAIKAIQLGAFDYLTKPLDVVKVREVVRRVLSSAKSAALEGTTHLTFRQSTRIDTS